LKKPEQIENVHKFISPMKLKAFSKRAFSIVAASLTIFTSPSFAKSEHIGKAYAIGAQAGAECHADKGIIYRSDINAMTKYVLTKNNYGHLYSWLKTSNGKKSVSIAKNYLNNNCSMNKSQALRAVKEYYKYL
tara:strand:- start:301 stop:699 length:399 start_codon:yes stop_codon:yes gene_type:complete